MNNYTLELMDKNGLKYGLLETIDTHEEGEFNGNSKAVYIGSKDKEGKWVELAGYTEEKAEELVNAGLYLFEYSSSMEIDGNAIPITSYYIPYVVKDHLSYEPTLRWMPILTEGRKYKAIVEWMFGFEGRIRYIYETVPVNITEENQSFSLANISLKEEQAKDVIQNDDGEYFIDMYDIFGNKSYLKLDSPSELDDYLLSVRLIAIKNAD